MKTGDFKTFSVGRVFQQTLLESVIYVLKVHSFLRIYELKVHT